MSRCKACNKDFEPRLNKLTGSDEDLCSECLIVARYAALDIEDDIVDDVELSLDMLDIIDEYN